MPTKKTETVETVETVQPEQPAAEPTVTLPQTMTITLGNDIVADAQTLAMYSPDADVVRHALKVLATERENIMKQSKKVAEPIEKEIAEVTKALRAKLETATKSLDERASYLRQQHDMLLTQRNMIRNDLNDVARLRKPRTTKNADGTESETTDSDD